VPLALQRGGRADRAPRAVQANEKKAKTKRQH